MEPTLVYVAVILNGVTLVSPEAVPQDKCENLRKYNQSIVFMCIEKEPDCGMASGNVPCKGQIIDPPPPNKRTVRRR